MSMRDFVAIFGTIIFVGYTWYNYPLLIYFDVALHNIMAFIAQFFNIITYLKTVQWPAKENIFYYNSWSGSFVIFIFMLIITVITAIALFKEAFD